MKSINQMVLLTVIFGLVAGLIYDPISVKPIFAVPPDPCFGKHSPGCPNMACSNNPATLTAHCCWTDIYNDRTICQSCDVNTDTGEFENCDYSFSKGKPDSSIVIPPPSGKAPPPSTEKCPDNSAVDSNGNCTPMTQLPDDTSDNNKPNLRDNLLNDMMLSQSKDSSDSGEEQENQSNG